MRIVFALLLCACGGAVQLEEVVTPAPDAGTREQADAGSCLPVAADGDYFATCILTADSPSGCYYRTTWDIGIGFADGGVATLPPTFACTSVQKCGVLEITCTEDVTPTCLETNVYDVTELDGGLVIEVSENFQKLLNGLPVTGSCVQGDCDSVRYQMIATPR